LKREVRLAFHLHFVQGVKSLISVLLLFSSSLLAHATPKEVLIIRHGEELTDESSPHLSEQGFARAQSLIKLFSGPQARFDLPDAIFACAPKRSGGSVRSIETVTPLARALRLNIDMEFDSNDQRDVAHEILKNPAYDGQTVLIAWSHGEIPKLAEKLEARKVPNEWPRGHFDVIWRIRYSDKGEASKLDEFLMHLMPGDD
jgi:hypothetical protein